MVLVNLSKIDPKISDVAIKAVWDAVDGGLSSIPVGNFAGCGGKMINAIGDVFRKEVLKELPKEITKETVKKIVSNPIVIAKAAIKSNKVIAVPASKQIAVSTVAAVSTNFIGNVLCNINGGETIKDSIKKSAPEAAAVCLATPVAVALFFLT